MWASGGSSATSRSANRSRAAAGASTSMITPRLSLATEPVSPSSTAIR